MTLTTSALLPPRIEPRTDPSALTRSIKQTICFYPYDYVLIVGQGRSGTNWLLQLLDLSPHTHCRNEPNEIPDSPMSKLPNAWVSRSAMPALDTNWDDAVRWTSHHMGERDQPLTSSKRHIHELSRKLQLHRLLKHRRLRSAIALLSPSLTHREWQLPWWLGRRRKLDEALPVLKLLQVPGWAVWVLANRPNVLVVHIVRHPGGFLHSWRNRYLARHDPNEVAKANHERLRIVIDADPSWAGRFGDIGGMTADESELWYWRYATETVHQAGIRSSAYQLVVYEDLVNHLDEHIIKLYAACGLPLDPAILIKARDSAETSSHIANAWRHGADGHALILLDRVALKPDLQAWWQSSDVVHSPG